MGGGWLNAWLNAWLSAWLSAWRKVIRKRFSEPVRGNPLHEAWTADGEPLERLTPSELAQSNPTWLFIVPHNRSR